MPGSPFPREGLLGHVTYGLGNLGDPARVLEWLRVMPISQCHMHDINGHIVDVTSAWLCCVHDTSMATSTMSA